MRRLITILLIVTCSLYPLVSHSGNVDSLLNELSHAKSDTLKYRILYNLHLIYSDSDYEKAIDYLKKSINVVEKTKHKDLLALSYNSMGNAYLNQGELDIALNCYNNALTIYQSNNDQKKIAGAYNEIGLIYKNKGKYELASENFLKSLKIYESLNDIRGISLVSNNIGQVQYFKNDYKSAIEYFLKYYDVNLILKNPRAVAGAANNIASAYMELNEYSKAIDYYYIALGIYDSLKVKIGQGIILDNLGSLYYNIAQYDEAMSYHKRSLAVFESLKSPVRVAMSKLSMSKVLLKLNRINEAIDLLTQALETFVAQGRFEQIRDTHQLLSEAYSNTNNYKNAFLSLQKYIEINDSIANIETIQNIERIKTEYESEKRQKEIDSIRQKLQNHHLLLFILGITIVVFFVLVFIIYYRNKMARRQLAEADRNNNFLIKKIPSLINTLPQQLAYSKRKIASDIWRILPDNSHLPKIIIKCHTAKDFLLVYLLRQKSALVNENLFVLAVDDFLSKQEDEFNFNELKDKLLEHINNFPLTKGWGKNDFELTLTVFKEDSILSMSDSHLLVYQNKHLFSPEKFVWVNIKPNDFVYINSEVDFSSETQKEFLRLFNTLVQYKFENQQDIANNTLVTLDINKTTLIYALKI